MSKKYTTHCDRRKFHYIYKITRFDGKYYVGLHSTDDLDDGYFGSGKYLWYSINKHGLEKHSKEIVEFLPDRQSLKDRERELVNEECVSDPMCMNLGLGGGGGDTWHIKSEKQKQEIICKIKSNMPDRSGNKNPNYGKGIKRYGKSRNGMLYKITTPDSIEYIYDSIKRFCDDYIEYKLNYKLLISVAKGRRNHHKGFKCQFIDQ